MFLVVENPPYYKEVQLFCFGYLRALFNKIKMSFGPETVCSVFNMEAVEVFH